MNTFFVWFLLLAIDVLNLLIIVILKGSKAIWTHIYKYSFIEIYTILSRNSSVCLFSIHSENMDIIDYKLYLYQVCN